MEKIFKYFVLEVTACIIVYTVPTYTALLYIFLLYKKNFL